MKNTLKVVGIAAVMVFTSCHAQLPLSTISEHDTFVSENTPIYVDTTRVVNPESFRDECYFEHFFLSPESHSIKVIDTLPYGEMYKVISYTKVDRGLKVLSILEGPYQDCP